MCGGIEEESVGLAQRESRVMSREALGLRPRQLATAFTDSLSSLCCRCAGVACLEQRAEQGWVTVVRGGSERSKRARGDSYLHSK